MSQDKKDQIKQAAAEDGVYDLEFTFSCFIHWLVPSENPSGVAIGAFSAAYLALIPVT